MTREEYLRMSKQHPAFPGLMDTGRAALVQVAL